MMSNTTALVIIDVQVGLMDGAYRAQEVLEQINVLLARARARGIAVIYVQHDGQKGHPLEAGIPGWRIHPAIAPLESETIIHKGSPDAFHHTRLQQELQQRGITHLIITGAQTEYCVDTTVRRAVSNSYHVTLVADAHTTGDTDILTAEQIVAFHNYTLDGFWADEHIVRVKPAAEIILTTQQEPAMTERIKKDEILAAINASYASFDTLLNSMSEEQMLTPGVNDAWSVKDNIAHLCAWRRRFLDRVQAARQGMEWHDAVAGMEDDEANELFYQQNKERTLSDVLTEFRTQHQRIVELVEGVSEEDWNAPQGWLADESIRPSMVENATEHFAEHEQLIRNWLARQQEAPEIAHS
ncbi:MAG TPA: isochorismatase family protein [Ktedonobacteraceae bacterium]|jgi:nicotinamidase-related amidase|nr:isochorismatase family protein [Ktedonobacteraceae bacterium]